MRHIPSPVTIMATHADAVCRQRWPDPAIADAQTIGSSYTSTAPKDCRVRSAGNGVDDSTIRVCPGKAGLVVLISEDDLRETVSVGRNRLGAAKEPAAQTWFGPFNSTTNTVEWRAGRRQAVRDHPALAHRRQCRSGQERPAHRKADAGGDAAAARPGLPCRLCRRAGQSQRQRTRPQGRRRDSRAISNAARTR